MSTTTTRSGRHKPKNPIRTALAYGTRLSAQELEDVVRPFKQCLAAARAGVATHIQHLVLHTQTILAVEIESTRIVRGLAGHIAQAQAALESWEQRAMTSGTWLPTALEFAEQDTLATFMDVHEYQLQQLSAGEIYRASQRMIARARSTGGEVLHVDASMATTHRHLISGAMA